MEQIDSVQNQEIVRGANIIAQNWLHLKMRQKVLIVSSEIHLAEVQILKNACMEYSLQVDLMVVEEKGKKVGVFFDKNERIFAPGYEHLYRRLSVRECARIQTFPDSFRFIYTNIQDGYKMVGNAVPPRMAKFLAEQLKFILKI